MRELTYFVGGSVGSDPYAPGTWSGSSAFLLAALKRAELLDQAVGLHLPRAQHGALLLKNFSPNRGVWRKKFYFDPAYRNALTRSARSVAVASPVCLQVGAMFSLPEVFPAQRCISFHDGNLSESVKGGYGLAGVPRARIDQALRYEEAAAADMSAIFTFSEYLRQSFIHDYRVPPEKVVTVGGAVNLEEIPAPIPDKNYAGKQLLFVGVDFIRKGGPQLLEAFAVARETHPDAVLHIVGPSSLGDLGPGNPGSGNTTPPGVVFHGRLSRRDPTQKQQLDALFRAATVFVMPSLYEPFGIAPLEAMLYGTPCLLTDAWAFREYITPGVTGYLVEKGSVDDLAARLTDMLGDPAALASMGAQARATAFDRYTWDAVTTRIAAAVRPAA